MINRLTKFLKDNNAYEGFTDALRDQRHYTLEEYMSSLPRREDLLLYDSFMWQKTKEGYAYWQNLNDKWRNKY